MAWVMTGPSSVSRAPVTIGLREDVLVVYNYDRRVADSKLELTRRFSSAAYDGALESWSFLDLSSKSPALTSPFGDVFFQAPDGIWWLDTVEGELLRPWDDQEAFRSELSTAEGQDRYLLAGLARGAHRAGLRPGRDEIYDFKVAPILGGGFDVTNVQIADFVVAVNIAGQIHGQVRDLPPGTRIKGFTIDKP
jgi:Domain of unknown function (DUF1851)